MVAVQKEGEDAKRKDLLMVAADKAADIDRVEEEEEEIRSLPAEAELLFNKYDCVPTGQLCRKSQRNVMADLR